ncbi:MAG: DNA helicase [Clostridiales bacterium]|nr:DNA helicase [Clostridiales bacterium]
MINQHKNVTKYLKATIAAAVNKGVDFKNSDFKKITYEQLDIGKVDKSVFQYLIRKSKTKETPKSVNVIIVAKTIKTNYDSQVKNSTDIEDLTGAFYIPAQLNNLGVLKYSPNKLPWIPRNLLMPITEETLAIGSKSTLDMFLSDNMYRIYDMKSWSAFFEYSQELFECVTKKTFTTLEVNGIGFENHAYIIKDDTINATGPIAELYEDLLRTEIDVSLYLNFVCTNKQKKIPLIINSIQAMNRHVGQMNGKFGLSVSQRECVNHFSTMENGEILAVNGPPGTGKTTLLQSIVANGYVKNAIAGKVPPLVVASSTNNQAVTNIIESFGNIETQGLGNLEERWLENVESLACYFPSETKRNDAIKNKFQHTSNNGRDFITLMESKDNIKNSKGKMIESCSEFFDKKLVSINECKKEIHSTLVSVNETRIEVLNVIAEIEQLNFVEDSLDSYINNLNDIKNKIMMDIDFKKTRVLEWQTHFKKLPLWMKLFKFITKVKHRIDIRNGLFMSIQESDFLETAMALGDIECRYNELIQNLNQEYKNIEATVQNAVLLLTRLNYCVDSINGLIRSIDFDVKKEQKSVEVANSKIDTTLRYIEFWLSVHYYECRWLECDGEESEKQKGKTFKSVLENRYKRLSMLTPCLVMTFYQLPKQFKYYTDPTSSGFLYNFIDLLIVDEAGQVSPEIAACSFALAKKAVIVGDIHQIEPVWSINRSLDISLAIESKIIEREVDFEKLDELGLNTSSSSVMSVASSRCNYKKYESGGLFLSEHRRCFNEIINYCNELVYNGHLEPMRGLGIQDIEYKLINTPFMGHFQVNTHSSSKRGSSRYNPNEAMAIATWIETNFDFIKSKHEGCDENQLIGVITPFKAQTYEIKKALKNIPNNISSRISVGTVHTFQGAERVIAIFSTVYGANDGCYFIDNNKSILNVAVSRSKDNFLVFGDLGCLGTTSSSASGLLSQFICNNKVANDIST